MEKYDLFAFVLMPFASDFDDIYKLGIKESATLLGFRTERVDEQIYTESILDRIYRQIDLADVIIADMTGQNPNVFYEVGYAHAKGKLCILITSNADDIPFDLKHRRCVIYGGSILSLKKNLSKDLAWAKAEVGNERKRHIKAILQPLRGELEKDRMKAVGHVDFKVDLSYESKKPSAEIYSAYFYSTEGWVIFQKEQMCASTNSDIPDFDKRHLLELPIRILNKDSWAQVKFRSTKTLARAWAGEEMKESYKLRGRSILRLITSEGNYDYELSIDVTVEEFPF